MGEIILIDKVIGSGTQLSTPTGATSKANGVDLGKQFSNMLNEAISNIGAQQDQVNQLNNMFEAGQLPDVHQLLIAAEKSSINLELTVQFRNKVIEAYQEIMRTQI